jgi:hypothetical protein
MNKFQLKKLIEEVLREVESEENDPETNSDSDESIPPYELRKKKFDNNDPILSLSLGGVNKNNSQTLKDFIGLIAYEAGKRQLEIIHAELEKDGKIGIDMDGSDIKRSEKMSSEKGQSSKMLPKGWRRMPPSPEDWNKMSPEERDSFLVPGSHSDEWKKATDTDIQKAKSKKPDDTNAKTDMGIYNFGREGGILPKNINLWTDRDWKNWERLNPANKSLVKFKIPNMDNKTWTDNDWKNWERLNPANKQKVQFNIPRYKPIDQ